MGVNAHILPEACPLCVYVYSPPFGSSKITVTVKPYVSAFSHSFGKNPAFTGLLQLTLKDRHSKYSSVAKPSGAAAASRTVCSAVYDRHVGGAYGGEKLGPAL